MRNNKALASKVGKQILGKALSKIGNLFQDKKESKVQTILDTNSTGTYMTSQKTIPSNKKDWLSHIREKNERQFKLARNSQI